MAGAKKKNKKGKPEDDLEEEDVGGEEELEDEESDEEVEDGGEGEDAVEESGEEVADKKSGTVILVNREKAERAKDIYVLVAGKRAPRDGNEADRKEHYIQHLSVKGVKPTDKEEKVVRTLYEILGGLVRNLAEQAAAEKKAAAQKEKLKKQKVAK
jgi:hypothetical protein